MAQFKAKLFYDYEAKNPINNSEININIMCFGKFDFIGTSHTFKDRNHFFNDLLNATNETTESIIGNTSYSKIKTKGTYEKFIDAEIIKYLSATYIILPLYYCSQKREMKLSLIPFDLKKNKYNIDYGQIGFITATIDEINKLETDFELEGKITYFKDNLPLKIKEYEDYLNGNCFGFNLFDGDKFIKYETGFYGEKESVIKNIKKQFKDKGHDIIVE